MFTWERLQDYPEGPLVKEIYHPATSRCSSCSRMHITRLGILFYYIQWECYKAAYPTIEPPRPVGEVPGLSSFLNVDARLDIATMVRLKRGTRGLRETANEIGGNISPSTLSRVEQGKEIDPSSLNVVCNWLGIPVPQKKE